MIHKNRDDKMINYYTWFSVNHMYYQLPYILISPTLFNDEDAFARYIGWIIKGYSFY